MSNFFNDYYNLIWTLHFNEVESLLGCRRNRDGKFRLVQYLQLKFTFSQKILSNINIYDDSQEKTIGEDVTSVMSPIICQL